MMGSRRGFLAGVAATGLAGMARAAAPQSPELRLDGRPVQGGYVIGRASPRAIVFVDGEALTAASANGLFLIGFDRDAPSSSLIEVRAQDRTLRREIAIAPGDFPTSRIDGLPPSTVTPTAPETLARIRRESLLKQEGFASRIDADFFREGFVWPLASYRVSSRWGSQRILNGTPARPHYGIDLAAPAGTPIRAPAAGVVTLAERDLHFEGGLTLIDHGQGLVSAYLHQSRLDVTPGQRLARGDAIGRVGASGRATGPHLCWRLKWRDRNLDPSLMVGAATAV